MHAERMEGVHITNHEVEEKKLLTNNEEEDLQYYNYIKSLKDYNNRIGKVEKKLDVICNQLHNISLWWKSKSSMI